MELKYKNKLFKNITRILLRGELGEKTLLYGFQDSLPGLEDFIEYGFKYWVDKKGYGSWNPLNDLNPDTKELIGTNQVVIQRVKDTLFPTYLGEKITGGPDYFGTLTTEYHKVLMFEIPPGYTEAYLFDDITRKDDEEHILVEGKNSNSWALVAVIITTDEGPNIRNVNLSSLLYSRDKDPHRNLNSYLLRNDEIPEYAEVVKDLGDFTIDSSSFTLLGTETIEPTLLKKRLSRLSDEWDPDINYPIGRTVTYQDIIWVSLSDKNLGENPQLSSKWMKLSGLEYKFPRLHFYTEGSGYVLPSSILRGIGKIDISYDFGWIPTMVGDKSIGMDKEIYESYKNETHQISYTFDSANTPLTQNMVKVKFIQPKVTVSGDMLGSGLLGTQVILTGSYNPNKKILKGIVKSYVGWGDEINMTGWKDNGGEITLTDILDRPGTIKYTFTLEDNIPVLKVICYGFVSEYEELDITGGQVVVRYKGPRKANVTLTSEGHTYEFSGDQGKHGDITYQHESLGEDIYKITIEGLKYNGTVELK